MSAVSRAWRVGYFATIMSGAVARFVKGDIEVSASRDGVCVDTGARPLSGGVLGDLVAVITAAERVHERLRQLGFMANNDEREAAIRQGLGPGWELEAPVFGERWPS